MTHAVTTLPELVPVLQAAGLEVRGTADAPGRADRLLQRVA